MKTQELLYKIGSILFVIVGIGHSTGAQMFESPLIQVTNQAFVLDTIRTNIINMFGMEVTALNAFNGLSYSFGILMFSFGLLNLLVSRKDVKIVLNDDIVMYLNIAMSALMSVVWFLFFFILPFLELTVAFICFLLAFIINKKST